MYLYVNVISLEPFSKVWHRRFTKVISFKSLSLQQWEGYRRFS